MSFRQAPIFRVDNPPDPSNNLGASNRYNGSGSVINTRTGHVIKVIRTGIKHHVLAYFPQPGRYSVGQPISGFGLCPW